MSPRSDRKQTMEERVYENRVRRMAKRQELELVKSRRRDQRATDFGFYWLEKNGAPVGGTRTRDLAEIERYLLGER